MRKRTTAAPRATRPADASGATVGKKQRKQADSVQALTALLAETRTAQRRLLILVGRLRSAETAIVAALGGGPTDSAPPAAAARRTAMPTRTSTSATLRNGRRRPRRPV